MRNLLRTIGFTTAATAALAVPLAAQIQPGDYVARRQALLAKVDSGVVVAFGGVEPVAHWPPFSQLPSFLYLTGFTEPNAAVVMTKRAGGSATQLYLPPRNLRAERFGGPRVGVEDAQARTGMAGRPLASLRAVVDSLAASGLPVYVVRDVETSDYAQADSLTRGSSFAAALRTKPGVLDLAVDQLRARKTPAEIAYLRRAAEISAAAHLQAMRATAPGCGEWEIQAALESAFRGLGGDGPGYGSIVGSGPNSLKLHYVENTRVMRAGDVMVIDAATAVAHYSADVTRTLPVSGRFTADQRVIYQMVLDAQAAFVRQVRAGAPISAANDSGRAVIAGGLARLGLIESPDATYDAAGNCPPGGCQQVRLFAWHGYGGHGIGLEVHDPVQYYYPPNFFREGDVFTVEPGVYVDPAYLDQLPDTPRNRAMIARIRPVMERYANIGVRIEDDYAITGSGVEWLSHGVPRDLDAVEAAMRDAPRPGELRCAGAPSAGG